MNIVLITGIVEQSAQQVKPGSDYGKMRLTVPGYNGRKDLVELVAKMDKIDSYGEGDMLAVRGSISGKENERGYINLSVFCDQIEELGVDSGTDSGYNEPVRKQPHQQPERSEYRSSGRKKPQQSYMNPDDENPPF